MNSTCTYSTNLRNNFGYLICVTLRTNVTKRLTQCAAVNILLYLRQMVLERDFFGLFWGRYAFGILCPNLLKIEVSHLCVEK